jgi:cytochrome c553
MKRTQLTLLAVLALAAAFIVWLSFRSQQPPLLPADETHAAWENAEACDVCHGPDAEVPKPPKHPLGFDCMRCHGRR